MNAPLPGEERGALMTRAAVIATVMVFGLTYSLITPLIAVSLALQGHSAALVGANAAMHAVGALLTAFMLPHLMARAGPRLLVLASIAVAAAILAALPHLPALAAWFALRFILGMATETLFVTSETWISAIATERTRARTMAAYTTSLSAGLALGPLLLSILGTQGPLPYYLGAALAALAGLFVASPKVRVPHFGDASIHSPLRFVRLAPVSLSALLLTAALETAALSFLALYAMEFGWSTEGATRLVSAMMIGAIALQIPIGWLGDKMDRRRLVTILAALSGLGAMAWPLVIGHAEATYALFFLWGGTLMGMQTIVIALVGSRFKGGELVGVFAATGLAWGVGSLVGPPAVGLAMQVAPNGFAVVSVFACVIFALAAWRMKSAA